MTHHAQNVSSGSFMVSGHAKHANLVFTPSTMVAFRVREHEDDGVQWM
jgi:hypothetical protein